MSIADIRCRSTHSVALFGSYAMRTRISRDMTSLRRSRLCLPCIQLIRVPPHPHWTGHSRHLILMTLIWKEDQRVGRRLCEILPQKRSYFTAMSCSSLHPDVSLTYQHSTNKGQKAGRYGCRRSRRQHNKCGSGNWRQKS